MRQTLAVALAAVLAAAGCRSKSSGPDAAANKGAVAAPSQAAKAAKTAPAKSAAAKTPATKKANVKKKASATVAKADAKSAGGTAPSSKDGQGVAVKQAGPAPGSNVGP